jgi:hypothetical protein
MSAYGSAVGDRFLIKRAWAETPAVTGNYIRKIKYHLIIVRGIRAETTQESRAFILPMNSVVALLKPHLKPRNPRRSFPES